MSICLLAPLPSKLLTCLPSWKPTINLNYCPASLVSWIPVYLPYFLRCFMPSFLPKLPLSCLPTSLNVWFLGCIQMCLATSLPSFLYTAYHREWIPALLMAQLPTFLPACLNSFKQVQQPFCLHARQPAFVPWWLSSRLPSFCINSCMSAWHPTFCLAYLSVCLPSCVTT
jgi:hypothetical protein